MSWWEAALLGLIQGITEFFPVSSSGHLAMLQEVLGLHIPGVAFEIVVHVATLVSVLVVYWEKVARLIRGAVGRGEENTWPYVLKLGLATVPAVLAVLIAGDWIENRFDDPSFVGAMLLVTGSFLWSTRWARGLTRPHALELLPIGLAAVAAIALGVGAEFGAVLVLQLVLMSTARLTADRDWREEPTWSGSLLIGAAQATALLPGISRSGSTVVTGIWRRVDPVAAAEFSFLMSVAAITGAALRMAPDVVAAGSGVGVMPLAIGFVTAAVSGVLAIRFFVALLRRQNFYQFAWYCWVVGILFLWYVRAS